MKPELITSKRETFAMRKVLDHGYVSLVESWGSDERVIEAARQSVGGGFVSWEPYEGHPKGDAGLLAYLWRKRHAGPFEFAGLTVEVQAPFVVLRQWDRHRTQSRNEMSARYAPLPEVDYLPTAKRLLTGGGDNKQAGRVSGSPELDRLAADEWLNSLAKLQCQAQSVYEDGLSRGVPKELARLALTLSRYSRMWCSANVRNWTWFLGLRMAVDAQTEIREYANAVGELIAEKFPRTYALFIEREQ